MKYGLWRKIYEGTEEGSGVLEPFDPRTVSSTWTAKSRHGGVGTLSLVIALQRHLGRKLTSFKAIDRPGFVSKFGHHSSLSG